MSLALITFIVSGVLIILMISLKMLQDRFEILFFWPNARNKSERYLQYHYKKVIYFFSTFTRRHLYIFLYYVLRRMRNLFTHFVLTLDKKSNNLVSHIKGKQTIQEEVRASHFLHDVRKFRDKFRKG